MKQTCTCEAPLIRNGDYCGNCGKDLEGNEPKKEPMKTKPLKYIIAKGNNKRIKILLCQKEGSKFFILETKRLIDFKTRNILRTSNVYSIETFAVIRDLMSHFLDNPEVSNKIINRELSRIERFFAESNFGGAI